MKTLLTTLIAVVLCIHMNAQQASPIADSNNIFAFKLYDEVKKDRKENLFFSPFSISTALAMTYAGARNETERQMASTMHFNADQDVFNGEYKTYLEKIESDTSVALRLDIANSLWIANTLKLLVPFKETVTSNYNSEARNVDFSKTEETRNKINTWVEQKTHDKIKELIKPHIIDAATRLVLVNAIYFNGKWDIPFSKDSTKIEDFHKTISNTIKAKFMHSTDHYRYYGDQYTQAIEIPYAESKTSMIIFLPIGKEDIDDLETDLDYAYYSKITNSMYPTKVLAALPKFKTTSSFQLEEALSDMGMPDAFNKADFTGMSYESLSISHVIHKAFIDVNEEGTEAAAATAVVMTFAMVQPRPVEVFNANHPFIFVIRDNATGSILFMGKIVDPTKE